MSYEETKAAVELLIATQSAGNRAADYPELNDDSPFLWFENEYVVDTTTAFILAESAADSLTR